MELGAFDGKLSYGKIQDEVDIALVSHDHADHNDAKDLTGPPEVVKGKGAKTVKGVVVRGVATFHDPSRGSEAGREHGLYSSMSMASRSATWGDLGHVLSRKELTEIGPVDILLSPIGGLYTIRPERSLAELQS